MSLTGALSNAGSGLTIAARSAELVATNVANALTEGYGRREIQLTTANLGGNTVGVRVSGVERVVDQIAIGQRRLSEADLGESQVKANFFREVELAFGTPDQSNSLNSLIANLESELILATAAPSDELRHESVISAAQGLATKINDTSSKIQTLREESDQRISESVEFLNSTLSNLDDVNDKIVKRTALGDDAAGLMDEGQGLIDSIANLIPIQELERGDGRIALMTSNGTVILDNNAAQFDFNRTFTITSELFVEDGNLSNLSLSGAASSVGDALDAIKGGSLAAEFATRDELAVQLQSDLDSLARDLVERTSDPLVDPTIGSGPGLFTDADSAFDPLDELGLSNRLSVNSALETEPWRIRDGLGTNTASTFSDPSILSAFSSAFTDAAFLDAVTGGRSFSDRGSDFQTSIGVQRNRQEIRETFASTQVIEFQSIEQRTGVDTDQEMQKLLVVEQAYAANARVIQAIDELMQTLLRI